MFLVGIKPVSYLYFTFPAILFLSAHQMLARRRDPLLRPVSQRPSVGLISTLLVGSISRMRNLAILPNMQITRVKSRCLFCFPLFAFC